MKKALKISLITLLSLVAVILIASSVIVWIVFTPSKLTPIVQSQTDKYINCQTEIGEVELTFFSTFPQFGLKINGMTLVNPSQGAASDTLFNAKTVVATLDLRALWKNNELIINGIEIDGLSMNAYIDKAGKANYDVLISDTTQEVDTSAFENPFVSIDLEKLILRDVNVSYVDSASNMFAQLDELNGDMTFNMVGADIRTNINVSSSTVSFKMDSTVFLSKADISLDVPAQYEMNDGLVTLEDAEVVLNGLYATISGTVKNDAETGDIKTDLNFTTDKYQLKPFLAMVPVEYMSAMEGMFVDGIVNTKGTVIGIYNEKSMPLIMVNAQMEKGTFEYPGTLPYKIRDIVANADVKIDMNDVMASKIIINDAKAKTGQSDLQGKGLVDYIMADDMLFDLDLKMRLNLPELEPMLPEDMNIKLSGIASGVGNVRFMLSDAMNVNLEKMDITGNFNASNLAIVYDTISMYADKAKLDIAMPNRKNKEAKFLQAGVWCDHLKVYQGKGTAADVYNVNLLAETSNIMETEPMSTMNCDFDFDQMSASMDSMSANIAKGKGSLQMKANFSDTISYPEVACAFDMQLLEVAMDDTTSAKIQYPKGKFKMYNDTSNPGQPVFDIDYKSVATFAQMGGQKVDAAQMDVVVNVAYNDKEQNVALQWVPTGYISMNQGKITVDGLNADIRIPVIQFDFTPDEYIIKNSEFIVDNSDFQLKGKLWNVTKYLRNEDVLKGDFSFTSTTTDVQQLMMLTSGIGVPDSDIVVEEEVVEDVAKQEEIVEEAVVEEDKTTQVETTSSPYMVPRGIDVILHTKIDNALLGYDTAKNVLGDLYIRDGLMVLEDVRLTTSAARMQLTAMYRTPRSNHMFAGIDFHLLDIEIADLLKMIPDIDTIMPMLRSFAGKGEFHIAVETYLDSTYNIKKSTLRGVSSIQGQNLVLMDGETFSEIAKALGFNKKTENKVDSLSAEFTIFKKEVDIYPFLIVMDKYKAVIAGKHNLDMSFNYHISVTDSPLPIKLGVDVKGTMDDMNIKPTKPKYANLYRPAARKDIDNKQLELRKMIRDALTKKLVE